MNPWMLLAGLCFVVVIGIAVAVIQDNGYPSGYEGEDGAGWPDQP